MTEKFMRLFGAIIVGSLLALPAFPAMAGPASDVSSQVRIEAGRRGVDVDIGRRHHRWESRRAHRGRLCETVRVTRHTPRGRVTRVERRCR